VAQPIRPVPPSFTPSVRPSETAQAAQRAFFDAAMGRASPTTPSAAPVAAKAVQVAASAVQMDADEPADRWARPGSRVDIKV
jgi:hypothetical protein